MRTIQEQTIDAIGTVMQTKVLTSSEGNSSVEIAVDAKGFVKPTVKVYDDNPDTAKETALRIWNELKEAWGTNMLGASHNK